MFPNVSGSNLLRQKINLPDEFAGHINLVFIPFDQWHQAEVDSWIAFASDLENEYPGLVYYELPTIQSRNKFAQFMINEGMRAGIPNPKSRERTITLYVDKDAFRQQMDLQDEAHIHILLVDRVGHILWRERGVSSEQKQEDLKKTLVRFLPVSLSGY